MEYLEQLQKLYELQEIYEELDDYYGDCEYLRIEEDWLVKGFIYLFNERFKLFDGIEGERKKYYAVFDDKELYDIIGDDNLDKAIPAILNTKYFSRDVFTGATKLNKKIARVLDADMLRQVFDGVKTVEDFDDIHELVYTNPKAEYQRKKLERKKLERAKPVKAEKVKIENNWLYQAIDDMDGNIIACAGIEWFIGKGVNIETLKVKVSKNLKYWGYYWSKIIYDAEKVKLNEDFKQIHYWKPKCEIFLKRIYKDGIEEINTLAHYIEQGYSRKSIVRAIASKKNYKTYLGYKWEYV